ncbi:MAG: leucyl aminopeptidase, partial [Acidimicrobiia bacterium]|nr:leucyl aminopeptidase [Acidimicrobiia bacterium]
MTAVAAFHPAPSLASADDTSVTVARSVPTDAGAVGVAVGPKGAVPRQLGLDRATLVALGFEGKVGQT